MFFTDSLIFCFNLIYFSDWLCHCLLVNKDAFSATVLISNA